MSQSTFRLSLFGDEIDDDLALQLSVAKELGVGYLELRGVWGKNVLHLSGAEVASVRSALRDSSVEVSCIGSPVGKSPLEQVENVELENLRRILEIARELDCGRVRVFSFYPPAGDQADADRYLEPVAERLAAMTELAADAGVLLLLENESGIVGDTLARCARLLGMVGSSNLKLVWDPANFVVVGEANAVARGWDLLGAYVAHVHMKDALLGTGTVTPAGEGDGEVESLLRRLQARGFDGYLALEPHLVVAGHSSGFSGPEGMRRAAEALRACMSRAGVAEARPEWAV
jgi:sugar phosphate isomerase/epimerase